MADGYTQPSNFDFSRMVNPTTGEVDRRIFSDKDIYQRELEQIFARCWNFMCHESQIPKPGDFFLSFIGDDSVIATRDKKGNLQVLLNTCRHRGNAVCRAEQGHANSFLCTYHGWTYGLDGKLIGVPGFKDFYHEDLDRSQWGLIAAPKVASYKGFVFACMDPDAPELDDYLGPAGRLGIDLMAARGEVVAVDGIQKNLIGCNWKIAVDNIADWYHPQISHASATMSMFRRPAVKTQDGQAAPPAQPPQNPNAQQEHRMVWGEYGHVISGPRLTEERLQKMIENPDGPENGFSDQSWRGRKDAQDALGPAGLHTAGHPNIFPNLWVASGGTQLSLRLPRGPQLTEIWWFTIIDKDLPKEKRDNTVHRAVHVFGPAGMLEQDDGENWDQSTRATGSTLAKRYPLNFQMNNNRAEIKTDNAGVHYADVHVNEHAQLWTYHNWQAWMTASSWDDLRKLRPDVPAEAY